MPLVQGKEVKLAKKLGKADVLAALKTVVTKAGATLEGDSNAVILEYIASMGAVLVAKKVCVCALCCLRLLTRSSVIWAPGPRPLSTTLRDRCCACLRVCARVVL